MTDFASGGYITGPRDPADDRIPAFLSPGSAYFPAASGELIEVGDVDADGNPSPAEAHFGADLPRRLNGPDRSPADNPEAGLWWLSFVDTTRSAPLAEQVPGEGGFLGVVVVDAASFIDAVCRATTLGINPGGEISGRGPYESWRIGPEWCDRLLTAADVDAMPCCTMHGPSCEPPAELCCNACDEAEHPEHPGGAVCVLEAGR
jgi:hypothetical protein